MVSRSAAAGGAVGSAAVGGAGAAAGEAGRETDGVAALGSVGTAGHGPSWAEVDGSIGATTSRPLEKLRRRGDVAGRRPGATAP